MPRIYTAKVDRICEQCGDPFLVLPCRIRQGRGRVCSHACGYVGMHREGPKAGPLEARLWSKIDASSALPCWLWTGRLNKAGYGVFDTERGPELAHRVAWRVVRGSLADDRVLRHVGCRVRRCVNPEHTLPGTQADNMADMARDGTGKGKHPKQYKRRTLLKTAAEAFTQGGLFGDGG